MQTRTMKKRLEVLEQECFPRSKNGVRTYELWELQFVLAFAEIYDGYEDSAPAILRQAFDLVRKR